MIPDDIFEAENDLTPGDYWSSLIIMGSGLGIAFVLDMHNKNINIEPKFLTSHKFSSLDLQSIQKEVILYTTDSLMELSQIKTQHELEEFVADKSLDLLQTEKTPENKELIISYLEPEI